MSLGRRTARAVILFSTATAGLLIAHELDYRLVVPDPAHRHDLLLRTGHGYLGHIAMIALAAGVLAASTALASGFSRGRGGHRITAGSIAPFLAVVQSGGFVLLEASERLIVGAPPDDRLILVTVVGVAVQVIVALLGSCVMRLIDRAGATIARAIAGAPRVRRIAVVLVRSGAARPARPTVLASATGLRGPPSLSFVR